ncbi:MAG: hypothetical protein H7Z38_20240 [Rubrivivax sp.]|nr:hypothetical protein [Pyrinomonadaceae bacterium]
MAENENAAAPAAETTEQTSEAASAAAPQEETPQPEAETPEAETSQPEAPPEEISYHAVEKDGQVTALWEMQGRKHIRTIDPRSRQGQEILRLYTSEHHDEQ